MEGNLEKDTNAGTFSPSSSIDLTHQCPFIPGERTIKNLRSGTHFRPQDRPGPVSPGTLAGGTFAFWSGGGECKPPTRGGLPSGQFEADLRLRENNANLGHHEFNEGFCGQEQQFFQYPVDGPPRSLLLPPVTGSKHFGSATTQLSSIAGCRFTSRGLRGGIGIPNNVFLVGVDF